MQTRMGSGVPGRPKGRSMSAQLEFKDIERLIINYFDAVGADVIEDGPEWFLSLYDEGPAISLTALAVALTSGDREGK